MVGNSEAKPHREFSVTLRKPLRNGDGQYVSRASISNPRLTRELEAFAAIWDRNLKGQGFLRVCK